MKSTKRVYLDFAATTPVDSVVLESMLPFLGVQFGNPSSVHRFGRDARQAVDSARQRIAKLIGASPGEIYFTGGGTEANNLAIQGIARARRKQGTHLITSAFEHPSVLKTFQLLEKEGFAVTYLQPDEGGIITSERLQHALTPHTTLVSIMMVNNEIGTRQPIAELSRIARSTGALFHTDAVQAFGKFPINVIQLGVDALSFSAHKIYGPKGVGGLYLRKGTPVVPLMAGGGQEKGLRPGTLNVPGIVGLATAATIMEEKREEELQRIKELSHFFIEEVQTHIKSVQINGTREFCSPYIVNLSFPGIDNQALQMFLDMEGIAVSTGSACHSGTVEPSHVLQALRLPDDRVHSAIRFSFGRTSTQEELQHVISVLKKAVHQLSA